MTLLEEKKNLKLQHKLNSLKSGELFQRAFFPYNIGSKWLAQHNKSVLVLVTMFNHDFRNMSEHQRDIITSTVICWKKKTGSKKLKTLICMVSYLIIVIFEK